MRNRWKCSRSAQEEAIKKISWTYLKWLVIPAAFVVIILSGHFFYLHQTVAVVGDYEILRRDVFARDKIDRMNDPEQSKSQGLQRLIKANIVAQVLKINGYELTDVRVQEEERRLELNAKSSEELARIKNILSNDNEEYKKVYVLPALAERMIHHDFFARNQKFQTHSLKKAYDFIASTRSHPSAFKHSAQKAHIPQNGFTMNQNKEVTWEDKSESAPELCDDMKDFLLRIASSLRDGDVYAEPADFGSRWVIVHYLNSPKQDTYKFEVAFIEKDRFDEWMAEETRKVTVKVY